MKNTVKILGLLLPIMVACNKSGDNKFLEEPSLPQFETVVEVEDRLIKPLHTVVKSDARKEDIKDSNKEKALSNDVNPTASESFSPDMAGGFPPPPPPLPSYGFDEAEEFGPVPVRHGPGCGNGVRSIYEECDDKNDDNLDGCNEYCLLPFCSNGIVDFTEECDDGNTDNGDGCNFRCFIEYCGNAYLDPGEECDDGNTEDTDGCSNCCKYNCPITPP